MTTFSQTYQVQFSFHFDETQRLLELARALPEDVYRTAIGYSHASMHNTFAHIVGADTFWRAMITGTPILDREPEDIASIDALIAILEVERDGWHALLATFDDVSVFGTIQRQTPWGALELPIWQTLQHVILHGMQHLTELARMLTDAGQAPGEIDFLLYKLG
jgi:uncharacterized damage-inducible protein DinB